MKRFLEKMQKVDRRILFLVTALAILIPIMHPLKLPGLEVTEPVQSFFDEIENLPPGSYIGMSFDFDPASKPELYPMALAVARHAFRKDHKIIAMNLWVTGTGLADEILAVAAKEHGKKYGEDYVFLGYQPFPLAVITGVCTNLHNIYSKDQKGNVARTLPVLKGIRSFQDVQYLVLLGAGWPGLPEWIQYCTDKYKIKAGAGCTAVSEPGLRPFYPVQITGLIPAMKGAAEYEKLIEFPDAAYAGLDAISLGHFLIIFLIFLCNAIPFAMRFTK
ncbi:hypothetical protein ACFL2T_05660 [Elusimicrobiota bacterium]